MYLVMLKNVKCINEFGKAYQKYIVKDGCQIIKLYL